MGSPQRPITSLHPNPPMIGRSRFSTEIKLAQGRARGGKDEYRGRQGRREGGEGGKEDVIYLIKEASWST